MAITTQNSIPALFRPGLQAVGLDVKTYPDGWKPIFKQYSSHMQQEIDVQIKMLSAAQLSAEGGQVDYDSFSQQYLTTYFHMYFKKGFMITRAALLDNLYKDKFPMAATALGDAMREIKNIQAFNVFNNAFSALNPLGDGQPLCSLNHPVEGGTFANTFAIPVGLNEAALEDLVIQVRNFVSDSGIRLNYDIKQLLVPESLQFTAKRLLSTPGRPETGNNDINALYHLKIFSKGYIDSVFLSSPTAFFAIIDHPNSFKYFEREPLDVDVFTDIDTDNLKCRALERYSFGCSNSRGVFGTQGA
jgi:hypothetical protein